MPAARQGQSNAMLNSLITFVVLFIVATVAAIIFYVKLDEAKTIAANETRSRREIATDAQQRQASAIVGEKQADESLFGTVVARYNELYELISGRLPEEDKSLDAATEQVAMAMTNFKNSFEDQNVADMAIMPIAVMLKNEYDAARQKVATLEADIEQIKRDWDREVEGFAAAEEKIVGEKNTFISQATEVQQSVDAMKSSAEESVERRINQLQQQIDSRNEELEEAREQVANLEAELKESRQARGKLESQIEDIKPRPDIEVAAYKPDGKVVSVDHQLGVVYLDLGSSDHVYRGLTFAVYDRSAPMPDDGRGKAEIRVFDVRSKVSVARIITTDENNPIIPDDIIVNLIWDKQTPNTFVVVGEFDLNGDGDIDPNGKEKVNHLIQSWGGIVTDDLDINTDFVVLGQEPEITMQPNGNDFEDDPMAKERYEQAVETAEKYKSIKDKAAGLSIPVFNTERFKNLIGYNAEVTGDQPF
jgi:hypothetical protein